MIARTTPPCPHCGESASKADNHHAPRVHQDVMFRRHRCDNCGRPFTTAQVSLTTDMTEKMEAVLD